MSVTRTRRLHGPYNNKEVLSLQRLDDPMRKLGTWIILYNNVFLQIMNQRNLKKLCKIRDVEMQWTMK